MATPGNEGDLPEGVVLKGSEEWVNDQTRVQWSDWSIRFDSKNQTGLELSLDMGAEWVYGEGQWWGSEESVNMPHTNSSHSSVNMEMLLWSWELAGTFI